MPIIVNVCHKTSVASAVSMVGHCLRPSIWQEDRVRSLNCMFVSMLALVEVGSGVVIVNTVLKSVRLWSFIHMIGRGRGRMI